MEVKCQGCGKITDKPQCHIERSQYSFCGDECRKLKCIPVICVVCGNQFLATARSYKIAKFCTKECQNQNYRTHWANGDRSLQIAKTCKQCGKDFKIRRCLADKQDYCSLKCFHDTGKLNPKTGEDNHNWKQKVKVTCKYCQKEFYTYPCRVGRKNYCCKKHATLGNLIRFSENQRTNIEIGMANILTKNSIEFEEQVVMFDKFMVDFLIEKHKLVVQCDGVYWHDRKKTKDRDREQDAYLTKMGYIVLRFTDNQILKHPNSCLKLIKQTIKSRQAPLINW